MKTIPLPHLPPPPPIRGEGRKRREKRFYVSFSSHVPTQPRLRDLHSSHLLEGRNCSERKSVREERGGGIHLLNMCADSAFYPDLAQTKKQTQHATGKREEKGGKARETLSFVSCSAKICPPK